MSRFRCVPNASVRDETPREPPAHPPRCGSRCPLAREDLWCSVDELRREESGGEPCHGAGAASAFAGTRCVSTAERTRLAAGPTPTPCLSHSAQRGQSRCGPTPSMPARHARHGWVGRHEDPLSVQPPRRSWENPKNGGWGSSCRRRSASSPLSSEPLGGRQLTCDSWGRAFAACIDARNYSVK
jgi:hypothetical protein